MTDLKFGPQRVVRGSRVMAGFGVAAFLRMR